MLSFDEQVLSGPLARTDNLSGKYRWLPPISGKYLSLKVYQVLTLGMEKTWNFYELSFSQHYFSATGKHESCSYGHRDTWSGKYTTGGKYRWLPPVGGKYLSLKIYQVLTLRMIKLGIFMSCRFHRVTSVPQVNMKAVHMEHRSIVLCQA